MQVAPAELEGCILDHPYAADVCVVGIPHSYSGEVPLAFVVLTAEGLKAAEASSLQSVTSDIKKVIDLSPFLPVSIFTSNFSTSPRTKLLSSIFIRSKYATLSRKPRAGSYSVGNSEMLPAN